MDLLKAAQIAVDVLDYDWFNGQYQGDTHRYMLNVFLPLYLRHCSSERTNFNDALLLGEFRHGRTFARFLDRAENDGLITVHRPSGLDPLYHHYVEPTARLCVLIEQGLAKLSAKWV